MVEDAFSHGSHAELTLHNRDADRVHFISLWDVSRRFRVKVRPARGPAAHGMCARSRGRCVVAL